MPLDPESLYRQLGQLVADTPDSLAGPGPITPDMLRWLGRASALVAESGEATDRIGFNVAADGLLLLREQNAHRIVTILHRALARAERNAPAAAQGAFIPVGAAFDVFQVIAKVLGGATNDILIIDPYMDAKVLTDFAPLAAERVTIRLLTDSFYTKEATLQPPAARWAQQYGALRPLQVRLTHPRLLHDRLIIIDGAGVWSLTQSLKNFAGRSPASVLRVEGDTASLKVEAYGKMWTDARPLP
jgi:hypothetical protein